MIPSEMTPSQKLFFQHRERGGRVWLGAPEEALDHAMAQVAKGRHVVFYGLNPEGTRAAAREFADRIWKKHSLAFHEEGSGKPKPSPEDIR